MLVLLAMKKIHMHFGQGVYIFQTLFRGRSRTRPGDSRRHQPRGGRRCGPARWRRRPVVPEAQVLLLEVH